MAGLIAVNALFNYSNAQISKDSESVKLKWFDLRWGLVGDLQGTGIEFPSSSLGLGGNYGIRTIVYSLRLNYNTEMIHPADAPPRTHIWDLGALIGKNFTGGKDGFRKIILSGGIGMIWGTEYIGTGMYSSRENRITSLGFIVELKIFWTFEFMGMGFSAIANINPEIHYFGGVLYIPFGFF